MMKFIVSIAILFSSWFSLQTWADKLPRLKLKAGEEITISIYFPESDVFEFVYNKEPSVGPNYATPEALQAALGLPGRKDDFIHKMAQEKGSIFVLKKELPQLWDTEVRARAARIKASRRSH